MMKEFTQVRKKKDTDFINNTSARIIIHCFVSKDELIRKWQYLDWNHYKIHIPKTFGHQDSPHRLL